MAYQEGSPRRRKRDTIPMPMSRFILGEEDLRDPHHNLVLSNIGLAKTLTQEFHLETDIPFDELYTQALLGLCAAAKGYDPTRGEATFGTYAHRVISNALTDWVGSQDPFCSNLETYNLSRALWAQYYALKRKLNRVPTTEEMLDTFQVKKGTVYRAVTPRELKIFILNPREEFRMEASSPAEFAQMESWLSSQSDSIEHEAVLLGIRSFARQYIEWLHSLSEVSNKNEDLFKRRVFFLLYYTYLDVREFFKIISSYVNPDSSRYCSSVVRERLGKLIDAADNSEHSHLPVFVATSKEIATIFGVSAQTVRDNVHLMEQRISAYFIDPEEINQQGDQKIPK